MPVKFTSDRLSRVDYCLKIDLFFVVEQMRENDGVAVQSILVAQMSLESENLNYFKNSYPYIYSYLIVPLTLAVPPK